MTKSPRSLLSSGTSAHQGAEAEFRIRKAYRNIGVGCLVFFTLAGVVSAYGMWIEAPPDRPTYAVIFVSLIWLAMSGLSGWVLLGYWRERLTIANGKVTQQGTIRIEVIELSNVTQVRWRLSRGISLRTATDKITIRLDNFSRSERLWLIRYFRSTLPAAIQHSWELFCYRIAIPLRDDPAPVTRTPSPIEFNLTRRRWDWYFVPIIGLTAVIGVVNSWMLQRPQMLAAPLPVVVLWLFLRLHTPKRGMVDQRISAIPELRQFLIFELWWGGVALAGVAVFRLAKPQLPHELVIATGLLVLWCGGLLWQAHRLDQAKQRRDLDTARSEVGRWDEGEQRQNIPS